MNKELKEMIYQRHQVRIFAPVLEKEENIINVMGKRLNERETREIK